MELEKRLADMIVEAGPAGMASVSWATRTDMDAMVAAMLAGEWQKAKQIAMEVQAWCQVEMSGAVSLRNPSPGLAGAKFFLEGVVIGLRS